MSKTSKVEAFAFRSLRQLFRLSASKAYAFILPSHYHIRIKLVYTYFVKIEFSKHSKERLKHRNISQQRVIQTLSSSTDISSSFRNRTLSRKRFGDKILEVITKKDNNKVIVVTAYYLKE